MTLPILCTISGTALITWALTSLFWRHRIVVLEAALDDARSAMRETFEILDKK